MLCVSFALLFAAGTCVGLLAGRPGDRRERRRSWLSDELDLTTEQREQMRQIWSDAMHTAGEGQSERTMALRKERDEAVQALLTDEQKAGYDKIMTEYATKLEELSQERRKRFKEAAEKTREILTEEQRKKYDELLARPSGGPHRGSRGGGWQQPRFDGEKRAEP